VLPNSNNVQPFALEASCVSGRANNTVIGNISSGYSAGGWAWLSWNGDMTDGVLQTSISTTPNSANYVNPADATDHFIDVGDWIHAKTDTANATKNSVDNVLTSGATIRNLIVPVFDSSNLTTNQIHVSGFALIQVTARDLNGSPDLMTFTFLRMCDSAGN
jgi:hypothetical protein